nr:5087_t:CDS:2 [Entrophospora candida]
MESATTSYNMRSPAVKRLLKEARELQQDTCSDYTAQPLEDNLFEWHFVIRGPDSTEFEGGRFELNKKICLSITGYHPEYWLPAWGIRTVLLALIGFLTTKSNGAIGGIDYTESERKILAKRSRNWKCSKFENESNTNNKNNNTNNNNTNYNNDTNIPKSIPPTNISSTTTSSSTHHNNVKKSMILNLIETAVNNNEYKKSDNIHNIK